MLEKQTLPSSTLCRDEVRLSVTTYTLWCCNQCSQSGRLLLVSARSRNRVDGEGRRRVGRTPPAKSSLICRTVSAAPATTLPRLLRSSSAALLARGRPDCPLIEAAAMVRGVVPPFTCRGELAMADARLCRAVEWRDRATVR